MAKVVFLAFVLFGLVEARPPALDHVILKLVRGSALLFFLGMAGREDEDEYHSQNNLMVPVAHGDDVAAELASDTKDDGLLESMHVATDVMKIDTNDTVQENLVDEQPDKIEMSKLQTIVHSLDYSNCLGIPPDMTRKWHCLNLDNALGIENASTYLGFGDGLLDGLIGEMAFGWAPAAGRCIAGLTRLKKLITDTTGANIEENEGVGQTVVNLMMNSSRVALQGELTEAEITGAQIEVYDEALRARAQLWEQVAGFTGNKGLVATSKSELFMDKALQDELDDGDAEEKYNWAYKCSGCRACASRLVIGLAAGLARAKIRVSSTREVAGGDCFEKVCEIGNTNIELANKGTAAILSYDKKLQDTMQGVLRHFTNPVLEQLPKPKGERKRESSDGARTFCHPPLNAEKCFGDAKKFCHSSAPQCSSFKRFAAHVETLRMDAVVEAVAGRFAPPVRTASVNFLQVAKYASTFLKSNQDTFFAGLQLLRTVYPPQILGLGPFMLTPYSACDVGHRLVDFATAVHEQQQRGSCTELNQKLKDLDHTELKTESGAAAASADDEKEESKEDVPGAQAVPVEASTA